MPVLNFTTTCGDDKAARIGGPALIGGVLEWPTAPDGLPLTLVMSIPTEFLNANAGFCLPERCYVSVFTYYSEKDYFLDRITYHGTQSELDMLRKGYTKVLLHGAGIPVDGSVAIPAMQMNVEPAQSADESFQSSKVGASPDLLQNEPLGLGRQRFAVQLDGSVFPEPYTDLFFLSDAIGYLYIDDDLPLGSKGAEVGTFFVQVT